MGKKLRHIAEVVCYMIRRGIVSKTKLMLDLQLLLQRGRIAGKAIANILTFNSHHHHQNATASFYGPREVEFSCTNTPSFFPVNRRKNRGYKATAAVIARAYEMLNNAEDSDAGSVAPSPSPAAMWGFGKTTPRWVVRKPRVTDSPFPIQEENVDGKIDQQAEEFIRKFYDQLRVQMY